MSDPLLSSLAQIYPPDRILTQPAALAPYECDALTATRVRPRAVVLPETQEEVVDTVRLCHAAGVPFVARGSGTSLSGGSVPLDDGIVIALNRLNRIVRLDPVAAHRRRRARRHQPRRHRGGRALRALLRARPVEPVGVHDRRQRGLQLRRRALPQIRHDGQPRARPQGRAGRTARWCGSAATAWKTWGPISPGLFVGIGGPLRHRARGDPAAAAAAGVATARCWRLHLAPGGRRRGHASSPRGLLPGAMEIMDRARDGGRRSRGARRLSAGAAAVLIVELEG
jgi:hypothetical protein